MLCVGQFIPQPRVFLAKAAHLRSELLFLGLDNLKVRRQRHHDLQKRDTIINFFFYLQPLETTGVDPSQKSIGFNESDICLGNDRSPLLTRETLDFLFEEDVPFRSSLPASFSKTFPQF